MSESRIPPEAIKAAWLASLRNDVSSLDIVRILEAAAPYMLAQTWDAGAMEMGMQTGDSMSDHLLAVYKRNPYRSEV